MAVDFDSLPSPRLVEEIDYRVIKQQMLEDLRLRDPGYTEIYESDPGVKILEVAAFREMLLRQRTNDAFMGTLIRYAAGGDLDNLGAFYNVMRLEGESDLLFRERIRIRVMGSSSAGPAEWYQSVALAVDSKIKQVVVTSPASGEVTVAVLSFEGELVAEATGADLDALGLSWGVVRDPGENDASYRERVQLLASPAGVPGVASPALLQAVQDAVGASDVRVVTDQVTAASVDVVPVDVTADIWLYPDTPSPVFDRLAGDLRVSFEAQSGIGWDVTTSWVTAQLQAAGVQSVELLAPTANVVIGATQAPALRSVTLTLAGRDR